MSDIERKINKYRDEIDEIDNEIISLLNKRLEKSIEIIKEKKKISSEVYNPVREKEIINRLYETPNNALSKNRIDAIYSIIFELSKEQFLK